MMESRAWSEKLEKGKCVIISGGVLEDEEFHRQILEGAEMVICADGGARHAKRLGIRPDMVMGDLDTLREEEIREWQEKKVELIKYPPAKDYTDTHLCLLKALELGYRNIVMIACLGGRIDHALANIFLLTIPQAREANVRICGPREELFLVKEETTLSGEKGELLSLFPLTEGASGIVTKGLAYQVPEGKFAFGACNGISNVFCEPEVKIAVGEGLLLAIRVRRE